MRYLFLFILIFLCSCSKESKEVKPYYDVVPVSEISNPFFENVLSMKVDQFLVINYDTIRTFWIANMRGIACSKVTWVGAPIQYDAPQLMTLWTEVRYELKSDPGGYVLTTNFADDNFLKTATWIKTYFQVRNTKDKTDKFITVKATNNPSNKDFDYPVVEWVAGDYNAVPDSETSNARIAVKNCDCEWIQLK